MSVTDGINIHVQDVFLDCGFLPMKNIVIFLVELSWVENIVTIFEDDNENVVKDQKDLHTSAKG